MIGDWTGPDRPIQNSGLSGPLRVISGCRAKLEATSGADAKADENEQKRTLTGRTSGVEGKAAVIADGMRQPVLAKRRLGAVSCHALQLRPQFRFPKSCEQPSGNMGIVPYRAT